MTSRCLRPTKVHHTFVVDEDALSSMRTKKNVARGARRGRGESRTPDARVAQRRSAKFDADRQQVLRGISSEVACWNFYTLRDVRSRCQNATSAAPRNCGHRGTQHRHHISPLHCRNCAEPKCRSRSSPSPQRRLVLPRRRAHPRRLQRAAGQGGHVEDHEHRADRGRAADDPDVPRQGREVGRADAASPSPPPPPPPPPFSLAPLAAALEALIKKPVAMMKDCVGAEVEAASPPRADHPPRARGRLFCRGGGQGRRRRGPRRRRSPTTSPPSAAPPLPPPRRTAFGTAPRALVAAARPHRKAPRRAEGARRLLVVLAAPAKARDVVGVGARRNPTRPGVRLCRGPDRTNHTGRDGVRLREEPVVE